jgi:proteic killer suppression protein
LIRSFASRDTERLYGRERVNRFRSFERIALRKLRMLDAATAVADLRVPPGNRLEKLKGDREGQWSIRINDQWRICSIGRTETPLRSKLWTITEQRTMHD